jgi:hypothetical protein
LADDALDVKKVLENAGIKVTPQITPTLPSAPKVNLPADASDASVSSDGRYYATTRGVARVDTGELIVKTGWDADHAELFPIFFDGDGKTLLVGNGRLVCPFKGMFGCPVDEIPTPILLWRAP